MSAVSRGLQTLAIAAVAGVAARHAHAQSLPDARIQAPELAAPGRASLAGEYGKTALEAEDVARGSFSLPLPLALPGERGAPGVSLAPSYSPGGGLSEWGMGWENSLTISRFAVVGEPDLDHPDGDLTGPWGRMARGTDGAWYPLGLSALVRVAAVGDELHAYLPDGTVQVYGRGADRVLVPRPGGGVATYTWHLSEVRAIDGSLTRFTWSTFGSARRYLVAMEYGGRGPFTQYRVELEYEALARPFVDYRAGVEQRLDRRVKGVRVYARHLVTGEWAERWRYRLGYMSDGWGPVFYLAEVERTFASGAVEPAARFGYAFASDAVDVATMRRVPEVEQIFKDWGADAIQPEYSTITDVDEDGRPDLEHHRANTLYRRAGAGFVREDLPPLQPGTHWACRLPAGPDNEPRELADVLVDRPGLEVVHLEPSGSHLSTELFVCLRAGALLAHELLDGDWGLGPLTRLVDLDRDQRPDLVKITPGSVEVRRNLSDETGVRFAAAVAHPLEDFVVDTAWVQDLNGDGVPDLVGRGMNTLRVWYGRGGLAFVAPGEELSFRTLLGWDLTDLEDHDLRFVDANHDGMTDVLLTQAGAFSLFANTGGRFEEQFVPSLAYLSTNISAPVVADLAASGNVEVLIAYRNRAYSIAFDRPETGLLATADDGKGNVLTLTYGRAPASPGAGGRPAVLASLETRSTGVEPVRWQYAYAQPYTHSVGRFLVGYAEVARSGARGRQALSLLQGDHFAGVLAERVDTDAGAPDVERFETHEHDDVSFRGVAWKRPRRTVKGWRPRGGGVAVTESSDILAYAAEVCPARARHTGASGTLVVERERAELPALAAHLHCVDARTSGAGTHADARWDFVHGQRIERDALGLTLAVWSTAAAGDLELQRIANDAERNVARIDVPGKGATLFDWRPATGLLEQVIQPDGVVVTVTARDPVTDAILELTTTRGARSYRQSFRYDGLERLERRWDDLGGAGESTPSERLEYRFADATRPAAVRAFTLVDAIDGTSRESVAFAAADGTALGEATRRAEGWIFARLSRRLDAQGLGLSLLRAPLAPAVDPMALDVDGLYAGARELSRAETSGFAVAPDTLMAVQSGVSRRVGEGLRVVTGAVVVEHEENGVLMAVRRQDAARRTVELVDEDGFVWSYAHDTAGRLREIVLPDGARHAVFYDAHGRIATITRTGVAQLAYTYEPGTGRLASVTTLTAAGAPRLERAYVYDALGRVEEEIHTDLVTGAEKRVRRYWDGATPAHPDADDDPGLLTAVVGVGFEKRYAYRVDGALERRTIVIPGWRTIETDQILREDGSVRERITTVLDDAGQPLHDETVTMVLDATGRELGVDVDGQPVLRYQHDERGLPATIGFPGGSLVFAHDPHTLGVRGLTTTTAAWVAGTSIEKNARGLVEREQVTVGGVAGERHYAYTRRGQLAQAQDEGATWSYAYDAVGRLSASAEGTAYDDLGRAVAIGELALAYGADGHLERARRGGAEWTFVTDEDGQRLVKLAGGVPVAAYLPEGFLDASRLVEPVRAAGSLVGVLENGVYVPLPVDTRGTVLADRDGVPAPVSPYGVRAAPALPAADAAAIDFVQHGRDPDLGLVRMGVRDYDPALGAFTTADPLVLAQPEKCLANLPACSLYAYARGNPLGYWDPSGGYDETIHGAVTYRLALAAGFNERDAAHLAIATAAVDHNSYTAPVSLGNIIAGTTRAYHFNRVSGWGRLQRELMEGKSMDLNRLGAAVHTLEDMGFADAPGPHALGSHPIIGHGIYVTERGNWSNFLFHTSDHAYENPIAYQQQLRAIFTRVLVPAAAARYGGQPNADPALADRIIREAVQAESYVQRLGIAVDRPELPGGGHAQRGYTGWVRAHNGGQTDFRATASWSTNEMDIPVD
jgi:RHS repeat-associated protein